MAYIDMPTMKGYVQKYFGDLGPQRVNELTATFWHESGQGKVDAYNPEGSSGLTQVYAPAHPQYDPVRLRSDPDYAMQAAREIYNKQGIGAWSSFNGGYYKQFMPAAEQARPGDVGSYSGSGSAPAFETQRPGESGRPSNLPGTPGGAGTPDKYTPGSPAYNDMAAQLDIMIAEHMKARPNPSDPKYRFPSINGAPGMLNQDALTSAEASWGNTLTDLMTNSKRARELAAGTIDTGNGNYITAADLEHPDPAVREQARATWDERNNELWNGYSKTMNELGLEEFALKREGEVLDNQRRTQGFTSELQTFDRKLSLDEANVRQAATAVDRQIAGLQESRARADLVTDALLKAAPYGTVGGKTDFSPNDLGSGVATLARQAGIGDMNAPILKFPGATTIDPGAMMAHGDQQFGVTGQLPLIPQNQTTRGEIPNAPGLSPITQGAPPLLRPREPVQIRMPDPNDLLQARRAREAMEAPAMRTAAGGVGAGLARTFGPDFGPSPEQQRAAQTAALAERVRQIGRNVSSPLLGGRNPMPPPPPPPPQMAAAASRLRAMMQPLLARW